MLSTKQRKPYKKGYPFSRIYKSRWGCFGCHSGASTRTERISLKRATLLLPCNIGRVFNLDAITMLDVLRNIEKIGEIKIIRTAGLDVIKVNSEKTFQECVDTYYSGLNE
jgi:hypothetical protein